MHNIKSFPKKVLGFFQNHFFITLALIGGIWWFSGSNNPIAVPYLENYAVSGDTSYDMAESAQIAPSMMKSSIAAATSSFSRGGAVADFIAPPDAYAQDFVPESDDRKLVKNASLTIEVKDTEAIKSQVEVKVQELNGQITNLNSWENRPGVLAYNMTLRIPVSNLDQAVKELTEFGRKTNENFSVQDITAQYQDNEARIANLAARRDRLRTMLDRETESLNDVLQVDRELNSVQQQIETLERTQRRNDNNVSYSTLSLQVQPEPKIGDVNNPEWSVSRSWKQAVNDFLSSLHTIFDRAVKLLVFAPIWLPVVLVLWIVKRKFFK